MILFYFAIIEPKTKRIFVIPFMTSSECTFETLKISNGKFS